MPRARQGDAGHLLVKVGHPDHLDEAGVEQLLQQGRAGFAGADDADTDFLHDFPLFLSGGSDIPTRELYTRLDKKSCNLELAAEPV